MAGIKKYTADEALSLAVNDGADALKVDLEGANINAVVEVNLDSANDSVTNTPSTASATVLTADGQIKGSAGTLWSCQVDLVGVTAGDTVEFENAVGASGTSLLTFTATAANQSFTFTPPLGIAYSAGIYCDITLTGGTATMTTVWS
tara:strand:+ start:145 stop:585 length:441 start_codon:yes stop_codon:yes gene_type:complete